jgi:hypothetical protein
MRYNANRMAVSPSGGRANRAALIRRISAEGQPFAALILAEQTQRLQKARDQVFIYRRFYGPSAASGRCNTR